MNQQPEYRCYKEEDEIDLLELIQKFWNGRKIIFAFFLAFFFMGLFVALLSPKEFTADTTIVPQVSGGNKLGGSLGGLAAMAGINLGGGSTSEGIPPTLYPKIVQSIPFKRALIGTSLNFEDVEKPLSYAQYYDQYAETNILSTIKKYTIGLPGLILSGKDDENSNPLVISDSTGIFTISKTEKSLFDQIDDQLSLQINDKEGYIELTYSMPEALPAAQMAEKAQNLLQEAITTFKVSKAKQQLHFIEQQYEEAKKDFTSKQFALASFQDQNRGLNSSRSQTRLEQLRSDYNISFGVFSELAKQLESQKIQVKEDTPAFTIIDPISIPLQKSKPKRVMIIAIWSFLGLVLGLGVVFVRNFIKDYKEKKVIENDDL